LLPRHLNLSFAATQQEAATDPWEQIDLSGSMNDAVRRATAEVERRKLLEALHESGQNKPRAAELLQVSYKTFLGKLKEYRIE
jgi:DNA-binding NtrC family response regulator